MGATLHRIGSVEADDPTLNHGGMIPHIYIYTYYIYTYIYIYTIRIHFQANVSFLVA